MASLDVVLFFFESNLEIGIPFLLNLVSDNHAFFFQSSVSLFCCVSVRSGLIIISTCGDGFVRKSTLYCL